MRLELATAPAADALKALATRDLDVLVTPADVSARPASSPSPLVSRPDDDDVAQLVLPEDAAYARRWPTGSSSGSSSAATATSTAAPIGGAEAPYDPLRELLPYDRLERSCRRRWRSPRPRARAPRSALRGSPRAAAGPASSISNPVPSSCACFVKLTSSPTGSRRALRRRVDEQRPEPAQRLLQRGRDLRPAVHVGHADASTAASILSVSASAPP